MKKRNYALLAAAVVAAGSMAIPAIAGNNEQAVDVQTQVEADDESLVAAVPSPTAVKQGWAQDTETGYWYYIDNGAFLKSTITPDNYYVDANGIWQTGWVWTQGHWSYFANKLTTGWQYVNGKWYYMDSQGVMQTGWKQVNGKWYYMSSNGDMKTGWQNVNGSWYYMNSNGDMSASTWVGDYYVTASGAMAKYCYVYNPANGNYYWVDANGAYVSKWTTKTKPSSQYTVYNQKTGAKIQ